MMGLLSRIRKRISSFFSARKMERVVKQVKERQPIKEKKVWKVDIERSFVITRDQGKKYTLEGVRVTQYYKIKPQQRWIDALKRKADALFDSKMDDLDAVAFLQKKGGEMYEAMEVRKVPISEVSAEFRKAFIR